MRISFSNRSYLRENFGARFGKMFRRSLPAHNTFLRSRRQNYSQGGRNSFYILPNEIRINTSEHQPGFFLYFFVFQKAQCRLPAYKGPLMPFGLRSSNPS